MKLSDLSYLFSRHTIILRIGAFALAILLWLFVVSEEIFTMVIDVPIEARNLSARKALKEEVPAFAQVRFSGTGRALFKARLLKNFYDDFKLVLDLNRISEEYDFVLNDYFERYPRKVVIPHSFEIEFVEIIYPGEIHISLDDYLVKTVTVRPDIYVEPIPGYIQVGGIIVDPAEIDIAGPKEIIQTITYVETILDSLREVESMVSGQIALKQPDRLIEYSIPEVDFTVDVQAISERIISEIPVNITNVQPGFRIFINPRTVSLTIVGGVNRIEEIIPDDIQITIDFIQFDSKKQFYEPQVIIPRDILEWRDLSPRNLELVVTKEVS